MMILQGFVFDLDLTKEIVICLHFQSTKRVLWLVDSWSRANDQIQMCPDRDTIVQLFDELLLRRKTLP